MKGKKPLGDAGDQYTGLDRFGRIVDQRWIKTSTGVATDRFKYGYDRNSNALYRTNEVNHNFDELYHASGAGNGYDQLDQLSGFLRGVLSASGGAGTPLDTVASPSTTKGWNYDATGNWTGVTTNGTNQTRTANQQNEITAISGLTTPTYDKNGNTTTDEKGQTYVYDAWNRLVTVKSGGTTIASYKFDGMGRRIVETEGGNTRDLFFDNSNVLEERYNGASTADIQYVWSPVYVNALILRDRSTAHNGTLDERLYIQQDANWNVTALINTSGTVVERYDYDPYGGVTYLNATFGTITSSAYAFNYLFQGERLDTVTGLYHMDYREYSPTLGRWLQNDPIGFAGGDNNLYGALSNNPRNSTDPPGLFPSTGFQILEIEIIKAQLRAEIKQSEGQLKRLGEISTTWRKCWNEYRGTLHEILVGNPGQGPFFNALDKENAERKHLADLKMALLSVTDPIRARGLIQFERNHPSGSDGLAFSPVLEDPVNLVGIGVGAVKIVLWVFVRGGARPVASKAVDSAANKLGLDLSKVTIKNGVARCNIGTTKSLNKGDIRLITDQLKGQGAKTVKLQARVTNGKLLQSLKNPKAVKKLLGEDVTVTIIKEVPRGWITEALIEITAPLP